MFNPAPHLLSRINPKIKPSLEDKESVLSDISEFMTEMTSENEILNARIHQFKVNQKKIIEFLEKRKQQKITNTVFCINLCDSMLIKHTLLIIATKLKNVTDHMKFISKL